MYQRAELIQVIDKLYEDTLDIDLSNALKQFRSYVCTGETTWSYTFYDNHTFRTKKVKKTMEKLEKMLKNIERVQVICRKKEYCGKINYQYIVKW